MSEGYEPQPISENLFVTEAINAENTTIEIGDYKDITVTGNKTGYYPLGIVGFWVSGTTGAFPIRVEMTNKSNGSVTCSFRVRSTNQTTAVTCKAVADILWIKA